MNAMNYEEKYDITTDSPPEVPTLEITTRLGCRVNCRYCPQKLLATRYARRSDQTVLTFETFKICVDKLPPNAIVCFAGFSEPFLSSLALDMLEYVHAVRRPMSLFTTLVGLTIDQFDRLERLDFRKVVLHLPDEKGFAEIPVTPEYLALFERVLEARKPDGRRFVDKMTCQTKPPAEIFSRVAGRYHVAWNMTNRAGNLPFAELLASKNEVGALECSLSKHNHNVLLPNGEVVLCSMDFGLRHVLGNLLRDDYDEITRASRSIEREAAQRKSDVLCRQCTEARGKIGDEFKNRNE